jgi:hypothetical protein
VKKLQKFWWIKTCSLDNLYLFVEILFVLESISGETIWIIETFVYLKDKEAVEISDKRVITT